MIRIKLLVDKKICQESLSRMGVCNYDTKILYPSAYIYEVEGIQYVAHFKELFKFINPEKSFDNMQDSDYERLNSICWCLERWELIECIDPIIPHKTKIDCIRFSEKGEYLIKNKIKIRNLESKN